MKYRLLILGFFLLTITCIPVYGSAPDSAAEEKPGIREAVVTRLEATVEAVDHEARKVTLKGPEGNSVQIEVDEQVKNLPQVEVGDRVLVEYIEAVAIQVFAPGEVEPGTTVVTAGESAKPGQKPAGVELGAITVVATIEAINKEEQNVTLKTADGESKTVKARNPDNLEKVVVGDKVMITYTEAIGVSVTEKMAEK